MEELSDEDLEIYFKSDKTHWYTLNSRGNKDWNLKKCMEFWSRFEIYYSNYNYVSIWIEEFIFPKFNLHTLKIFNRKEEHSIFFKKCIFLGDVHLHSGFRSKSISIQESFFYDKVEISHIDCENLTLSGNFFFKEFNLIRPKTNSILITDSIFNKDVHLNGVSVDYKYRMERIILFEKLRITDLNDISVGRYYFNDLTSVNNSQISIDQFIALRSFIVHNERVFRLEEKLENKKRFILGSYNGKHKTLINDFISYDELERSLSFFYNKDNRTEKPNLIFESSNLNDKVYFNSIDFLNTEFIDSKLIYADFGECDWNVRAGRLLLFGEGNLSYKQSESNYRQLKRNFSMIKHWELSGYAYVSEMEMRKKRLWEEKKYFEWIIYAFYGCFGGYTQSIKKPLISLFGLMTISSMVYYFVDFNWLKAIQRGIKGALPYIQIDTENPFTGYWLILRNIEFLLGATFLTFFILALRKRFKQ